MWCLSCTWQGSLTQSVQTNPFNFNEYQSLFLTNNTAINLPVIFAMCVYRGPVILIWGALLSNPVLSAWNQQLIKCYARVYDFISLWLWPNAHYNQLRKKHRRYKTVRTVATDRVLLFTWRPMSVVCASLCVSFAHFIWFSCFDVLIYSTDEG